MATTITSNVDLALEPVEPWTTPEVEEISPEDISASGEAATSSLAGLEQTAAQLKAINEPYLKGQISDDVASQLRAQSAETALAGGIGTDSAAARSLQARDFGLTSMQIQQQGIQTATAVASIQEVSSKMREDRYRFMETLSDERKKFVEQSRQFGATLAQDAQRTQIAFRELLLKQDMFNKEQNLRSIEMMANLGAQQAAMQVQAATSGTKFNMGPVNTIFNNLISSINSTLKRSNP
jgi:hypothetical protein